MIFGIPEKKTQAQGQDQTQVQDQVHPQWT